MYLIYVLRVKDQGETKDEPRMNQRTPKLKKVLLLRLPSFFLLLYLPSFCRPTTERTPREERINSLSKKVLFLKIDNLKRLTESLKKLTLFLKHLTLCTSFAFLRTLSMPLCPLVPNQIRVNPCLSTLDHKLSTERFAQSKINLYLCKLNKKEIYVKNKIGHTACTRH